MKIAVLGSAFDAPTLGHLDVINQCLEQFDEVWLVPSYKHAFGKKMSDYTHREKMAEAFTADINNSHVKLVACEPTIKVAAGKAIYSIDLLTFLKNKAPNNQYSLIIGPDNEASFDKFYQADRLKAEFSPYVATEKVKIRSTLVRTAIKLGAPTGHLLSTKVKNYILTTLLYL